MQNSILPMTTTCLVFIILYISIGTSVIGCVQRDRVIEASYYGLYKINMQDSDLGEEYDKETYHDLTILLDKSGRFKFSDDVPFIYIRSGQWRYCVNYDGGGYGLLKMGSWSEQFIGNQKNGLVITHPQPKEGSPQAQRLSFDRIAHSNGY